MLHCETFFFVTIHETVALQYSQLCNLGIPIWCSFIALVIDPGVRASEQVNLVKFTGENTTHRKICPGVKPNVQSLRVTVALCTQPSLAETLPKVKGFISNTS